MFNNIWKWKLYSTRTKIRIFDSVINTSPWKLEIYQNIRQETRHLWKEMPTKDPKYWMEKKSSLHEDPINQQLLLAAQVRRKHWTYSRNALHMPPHSHKVKTSQCDETRLSRRNLRTTCQGREGRAVDLKSIAANGSKSKWQRGIERTSFQPVHK